MNNTPKVGWSRCPFCLREMKTSAKIGSRIRCRFETCGRTFKVRVKLGWRVYGLQNKVQDSEG